MSNALDDLTWKPETSKDRIKRRIRELSEAQEQLLAYVQHLEVMVDSLQGTLFNTQADLEALRRVGGFALPALTAARREYIAEVRQRVDMQLAAESPQLWFWTCVLVCVELHRIGHLRAWAQIAAAIASAEKEAA